MWIDHILEKSRRGPPNKFMEENNQQRKKERHEIQLVVKNYARK